MSNAFPSVLNDLARVLTRRKHRDHSGERQARLWSEGVYYFPATPPFFVLHFPLSLSHALRAARRAFAVPPAKKQLKFLGSPRKVSPRTSQQSPLPFADPPEMDEQPRTEAVKA